MLSEFCKKRLYVRTRTRTFVESGISSPAYMYKVLVFLSNPYSSSVSKFFKSPGSYPPAWGAPPRSVENTVLGSGLSLFP